MIKGTANVISAGNDTLCKHMVALAIYAVKEGGPRADEDKRSVSRVTYSGCFGELSREELSAIKKEITGTMKHIKPYDGPSRIWFSYQNSLSEGCARLSKIVSELPTSEQTTKLLVDMLLRLDDKFCRGGVDDSDGTVGGFIEEPVHVLKKYAKLNPTYVKAFQELRGRETCFGWEEPLLELIKK